LDFQQYDLGSRKTGEIVEVTLGGNAANVQLMDDANFRSYRSGRQYRYQGGHVTRSPYRVAIPHSGHWHVAIDLGGYAGRVKSSVRVIPAPHRLPAVNQSPLASVPSLVQTVPPHAGNEESATERDYDVFISHASEDKDSVVRPLAHALLEGGLEVWFDEFELRIGDSLRRKIDAGLAKSRFGVVVLSRSFFGKGWTNYELDGLVTRSVDGDQVLLPVWHDITKQEVIEYSPSLADKVARSTATHTVQEIAAEIIAVIRDA
jgi:hypothetical protein